MNRLTTTLNTSSDFYCELIRMGGMVHRHQLVSDNTLSGSTMPQSTSTQKPSSSTTRKTTANKTVTKASKPSLAVKRVKKVAQQVDAYGQAIAPTIPMSTPEEFGRVIILQVEPSNAEGRYCPRVELGETFPVSAQVFTEGRSAIGVAAVLKNPQGRVVLRTPLRCTNRGLDQWEGQVRAGLPSSAKPWEKAFSAVKRQLGSWQLTIEGWLDPYASWLRDASIRIPLHDDIDNTMRSGSALFARWATIDDTGLKQSDRNLLTSIANLLLDENLDPFERYQAAR